VHDVAVPLDRHELDEFHGLGPAHLGQVVAREVHEHEVLGEFLRVGEQFRRHRLVRRGRRAARARPGDRERGDLAALHLHQRLRAGAHHGELGAAGVRQTHVVHIGTRVDGPQHAVDVERVRGAVEFQALGDDHLEHLAVADRFLRGKHGGQEVLAPRAEAQVGLGGVRHEHRRARGAGTEQVRLHAVEAGDGVRVGLIHAFVRGVHVDGVGDQPDRGVHVVDGDQVGGQAQAEFRDVELVRREGAQGRLPVPQDVPPEGADESAGQRGQAGDRRGVQHVERRAEDVEDVAVDRDAHGEVAGPNGPAVRRRGERGGRAHPHERPPRPLAAELGRFEDERARAVRAEAAVDVDGREVVAQQAPHHRDDAAVTGLDPELREVRPRGAPGGRQVRRPAARRGGLGAGLAVHPPILPRTRRTPNAGLFGA